MWRVQEERCRHTRDGLHLILDNTWSCSLHQTSWPCRTPLWPERWSIREPVHSRDKIRERRSDKLLDRLRGKMSEVDPWPSASHVLVYQGVGGHYGIRCGLTVRMWGLYRGVILTMVCHLGWTSPVSVFLHSFKSSCLLLLFLMMFLELELISHLSRGTAQYIFYEKLSEECLKNSSNWSV